MSEKFGLDTLQINAAKIYVALFKREITENSYETDF